MSQISQHQTPALANEVERWSLTSLRQKQVKMDAKIDTHARYVIFQIAAVAVPRMLFADNRHRFHL